MTYTLTDILFCEERTRDFLYHTSSFDKQNYLINNLESVWISEQVAEFLSTTTGTVNTKARENKYVLEQLGLFRRGKRFFYPLATVALISLTLENGAAAIASKERREALGYASIWAVRQDISKLINSPPAEERQLELLFNTPELNSVLAQIDDLLTEKSLLLDKVANIDEQVSELKIVLKWLQKQEEA